MNFLHAENMRTALGRLPGRGRLEGLPDTVILGARPEHFADSPHDNGFEFEATPELVESMGSDKYAYFSLEGQRASTAELEELAADAGLSDLPGGGTQLVARLPAGSPATVGRPLKLWLNLDKVHAFDPRDGRTLT
jgi:multiple sugar transport system ATP-binding protein